MNIVKEPMPVKLKRIWKISLVLNFLLLFILISLFFQFDRFLIMIDNDQKSAIATADSLANHVEFLECKTRKLIKEKNDFIIREVCITAYNAVKDQTDSDPFVTASGKPISYGQTLALSRDLIKPSSLEHYDAGYNSYASFEYGDKVVAVFYDTFRVEDTMNRRYNNRADILMPDISSAVEFGFKLGYLGKLD